MADIDSTGLWPNMHLPTGLTLGDLRRLTADLPDDTPIKIEDAYQDGPIPGSAAELNVTCAARDVPLYSGGCGVLLRIEAEENQS